MFFSSPSVDIQIIFFLLVASLIIAIASYIFSKKILVGVFVMSLLSNVILYLGIDYNLAKIYSIIQLFQFTRDIFPYINIVIFVVLVINFIRTKYAK